MSLKNICVRKRDVIEKTETDSCPTEEKVRMTILELNPGQKAEIVSLPTHALLAPLGLRKGKKVEVKARQPLGGPVIVDTGSRQVALDRKLAKQIELGERNGRK